MSKTFNIKSKFIFLGLVGFFALSTIVLLALDVSKNWLESLENVFKDSQNVQIIQKNYIAPIFLLRELSLSLVVSPNKDFQKEIVSNIDPLLKNLSSQFPKLNDNVQKEWTKYKQLLEKTRKFIDKGFEEGAFINVNKDERKQFYILVEVLQNLQSEELKKSLR